MSEPESTPAEEPTPPAETPPPAPRRRRWKRAVAVALGLLLGAGALFVIDLLAGYPPLPERPPGAGAEGPGWRVASVGGVPLLLVNGLPYPTDFTLADDRPRLDLNGAWQIRLDPDDGGLKQGWAGDDGDAGWEAITVPSTHDAVQGLHPDYDGVAWFRRRFTAPTLSAGGRARLCFRGVLLRSAVWLNGQKVGDREGGYTPFYFDVTALLRPGENQLVVRSDDRPTYTSVPPRIRESNRHGWAQYGGIFRDVYLERLPATYVAKLAATPAGAAGEERFDLDVVVHGAGGEFALRARAVDVTSGKAFDAPHAVGTLSDGLGAVRLQIPLGAARRWSHHEPRALYRIELTLSAGGARDRVQVETGFRTVGHGPDGLTLNGAPLRLRGIAKHEDHPVHGATQPAALLAADVAKLKAMNANFMRVSHYPHATAALRAAREAGLLMMEEIPLYQAGMGWLGWAAWDKRVSAFPRAQFGLRHLHDERLLANAQLQLIEMIERDRHNPAIVLWSVGNECYTLFEGSQHVYRWLADVVRAFDATRPVSFSELTFGVEALDGLRRAGDALDVPSINMYFGWYFGTPADAGASLDAYRARYPDKPIIISECGAGAHLGRTDAEGIWNGEGVPGDKTYSEAFQAELLAQLFAEASARSFVTGFCPWVFADFRCPWFPKNPVPGYNMKGVLTRERKPKQGYERLRKEYGAAGRD